jgi:hypothetical protein
MKNSSKKDLRKTLASIKKGKLREDLKHILNPLEQAALQHHYKPFVYNYEGIQLYISRRSCMQLMDYATDKITFLTNLIEQERLSTGIPVKYREAFNEPRLILALPARLRNHLVRLGCYTLFAIMQKGRSHFVDEHKFSVLSMQRLDVLFATYKSGHLFRNKQ